jgi:probable HAF family extracellular repeat protein
VRRRGLAATLSLTAALLGAVGCDDSATMATAADESPVPVEEIRDLPGLGGPWAIARAINDFGRVVGEASVGGASWHAFSWSELGGIRDLGTLGGPLSAATAINSGSQVVGWSWTTAGVAHAFLLTVGQAMRDLGTPPGRGRELGQRH